MCPQNGSTLAFRQRARAHALSKMATLYTQLGTYVNAKRNNVAFKRDIDFCWADFFPYSASSEAYG